MLKYSMQDRVLPYVWDISVLNGLINISTSVDSDQGEINVADEKLDSTYWKIFISNGVIGIETSLSTVDSVTIFDETSTAKQYRLGVWEAFLRAPQVIVLSTDFAGLALGSSSSSSSSSSSKSWQGVTFGEEFPSSEMSVVWQTWRKTDTTIPSVLGNANWGKVSLAFGEQALSPVEWLGNSGQLRTFTLLTNKYGFGTGNFIVSIRGSDTPFDTYDIVPAWETYFTPITRTWSYVQTRLEGA
jgi:hypothetical protein